MSRGVRINHAANLSGRPYLVEADLVSGGYIKSGTEVDTFASDGVFNIGAGDPTSSGTSDYAYLHLSGGVMYGGFANIEATNQVNIGTQELTLTASSAKLNGLDLQLVPSINTSDTAVYFDQVLSGGTAYEFTQPLTGMYFMDVASSVVEDTFIFTAGPALTIDLPASVGLVEGGVVESGVINISSGHSYIMSIQQLKAVIVEYTP